VDAHLPAKNPIINTPYALPRPCCSVARIFQRWFRAIGSSSSAVALGRDSSPIRLSCADDRKPPTQPGVYLGDRSASEMDNGRFVTRLRAKYAPISTIALEKGFPVKGATPKHR
jgi:hypothetical protein